MLYFDSNHSSIEGDINKTEGKKKVKKIVVVGLIISNIVTFSSCAKDVPCDVIEDHAHLYVNDEGIGRYIVSEKSSKSGLDRLDDYIAVNREDEELLEFIDKENLFKIDNNRQAIKNITDQHEDYKEYRYSYRYLIPTPVPHSNGKTTYITYNYIPKKGYSWTNDKNKNNLTGEERICQYVYYGYRIVKNEKGKYELSKSDPVDNINDLPEGYDYIQEEFYEIVNANNKKALDYEDGPEDEKELIDDEEYNKAAQRTRK